MIRTFGAIESLLQGDDMVDVGDRTGAATIKPGLSLDPPFDLAG
jgi:hypothetical protein